MGRMPAGPHKQSTRLDTQAGHAGGAARRRMESGEWGACRVRVEHVTDATALLSAAGYNGRDTTRSPSKTPTTAVATATMRLDTFNNASCD